PVTRSSPCAPARDRLLVGGGRRGAEPDAATNGSRPAPHCRLAALQTSSRLRRLLLSALFDQAEVVLGDFVVVPVPEPGRALRSHREFAGQPPAINGARAAEDTSCVEVSYMGRFLEAVAGKKLRTKRTAVVCPAVGPLLPHVLYDVHGKIDVDLLER